MMEKFFKALVKTDPQTRFLFEDDLLCFHSHDLSLANYIYEDYTSPFKLGPLFRSSLLNPENLNWNPSESKDLSKCFRSIVGKTRAELSEYQSNSSLIKIEPISFIENINQEVEQPAEVSLSKERIDLLIPSISPRRRSQLPKLANNKKAFRARIRSQSMEQFDFHQISEYNRFMQLLKKTKLKVRVV